MKNFIRTHSYTLVTAVILIAALALFYAGQKRRAQVVKQEVTISLQDSIKELNAELSWYRLHWEQENNN